MLIGLFSAVALGCGGMFGGLGDEVYSSAQQALFEPGDSWVDVTYLVNYGGDQTDFGWVVPVPGAFVELAEGDVDQFSTLCWQTYPEVNYHAEESGGCAGQGKGLDGGSNSTTGDVTVVGQGSAGVFDYVALAATDSVALVDWLETNGWSVGPSGPSLDAYVADGGWQFVAIALSEEVTADDAGAGGQAAARIRYDGDQMVFPARMSRYSVAPEQTTTLFVAGNQRATLEGWDVVALPIDHVVHGWDMSEALRQVGADGPSYALTFADQLEGEWVTRFDVVAASADHGSDVVLSLDGGTEAFYADINVYETQELRDDAVRSGGCATARPGSMALGWLWLGALVLGRRRRALG